MRRLLVLLALLLLPTASALRLEDNLHFTIPPDNRSCIEIVLPDDAGSTELAKAAYAISSDAPWGDLKEGAVFSTDGNNTAVIPLCFATTGIAPGNCSAHTITIRSEQLSKRYRGGVCVSRFADVDVAPLPAGGSVADVLNANADVFALGFREPLVNGQPGQILNLTLLLQSQALANYTIELQGTTGQAHLTASTSPASPRAEFSVPVRVPEGEAEITAIARRACSQAFCTKTAKALVRSLPASGFTLTLFPPRYDLPRISSALYDLTLRNNGPPDTFQLTLELPQALTSTFSPTALNLSTGEERTVQFFVTPSALKQLSEFTAVAVSSRGAQRSVTGVLSTQELATDAQRQIEALPASAKPGAQKAYNSWYTNYQKDHAGTGDYAALQKGIADAKGNASKPAAPAPAPPAEPAAQIWLYLIPAALAAAAAAWLFIRRRSAKPRTEFSA